MRWGDDFTVKWYEGDSQTPFAEGTTLYQYDPDQEYQFEIVLGETLGKIYWEPKREIAQFDKVTKKITIQLTEMELTEIQGTVRDSGGEALSGVQCTFTQRLNDRYEETSVIQTDTAGHFQIQVRECNVKAEFFQEGYRQYGTSGILELMQKKRSEGVGDIAEQASG